MPTDDENLRPANWPHRYQEKLDALRPQFEPFASALLPTTPGTYLDNAGDPWTLATNGHWFDKNGETRPTGDNWMLVTVAPFTPIS